MKVLFIGGTGIISSACVELAVARGIELMLLNRGHGTRPIPAAVPVVQGDIRDKEAVSQTLKDLTFDVVVNFVAFTPEHIETDLELFRDRTKQYIFISSASAYQTPPLNWPTTESTPLRAQKVDENLDQLLDTMVAAYEAVGPRMPSVA